MAKAILAGFIRLIESGRAVRFTIDVERFNEIKNIMAEKGIERVILEANGSKTIDILNGEREVTSLVFRVDGENIEADMKPFARQTIKERPCPRCGKMIDTLKAFEPAETVRYPTVEMIMGKPSILWEAQETNAREDHYTDFECPECSELLFTDEEAADNWLLDATSTRTPQWTNKFYNVIRISREDIASSADEDKPHLQEAARFLKEWEVERIASKVGDSLMDQGDYHIALQCWSEDYLQSAYELNKKAILEAVKDKITSCPTCGMNPNDGQSEEQQKWELDYVHEHGQCSACDLEDSEKKGVENAIKNTADPRELEDAQEKTDAAMDKADEQELDRKYCQDEPDSE